MAWQDRITNGENHWIARHLGVTQPQDDPIGWGIGLAVIAARRIGHPISWDDAEQLTDAQTGQLMDAAEHQGDTITHDQRSEALAGLIAAIDTPATEAGDASPEPQRAEPATPTSGPTPAPRSPSTVASLPGTPNS